LLVQCRKGGGSISINQRGVIGMGLG